jgi:hypothetical protein
VFLYFFCNLRTASAVPHGLESSITSINISGLGVQFLRLIFSMSAASQYVGRIRPITESASRFPFIDENSIVFVFLFGISVHSLHSLCTSY